MKRSFKKQEIDCKASDGANGVSPILKSLPAPILGCKYSLQNESFEQLIFLSGILWGAGCVYVNQSIFSHMISTDLNYHILCKSGR